MAVESEPLFMDVHETTIAWMHSLDKIQVIDVSGGIRGMKGKFRKSRKPMELKCDIIGKNEQRKDTFNGINIYFSGELQNKRTEEPRWQKWRKQREEEDCYCNKAGYVCDSFLTRSVLA
jgi:hypothetical protein